jgi:hypothetical protein
MNKMVSKGVNIIAIALQEIWQVPYPELVQLPNFNFFHKTRTESRGGGVGFYILNTYRCKIIKELSPFVEKEFESLTIEISHKNKKFVLCNIYRSPTQLQGQSNTTQIDNFNIKIDELLQNIYSRGSDAFVFLDANINLLKLTSSKTAFDYLETVHSNGFLQLISKATRIAGDSYSLIDHILCKNFNQSYATGTLIADISDHFINCLSIPNSTKKAEKYNDFKWTRIFSNTNMQNFRNDLGTLSWNDVLQNHDTNSSFDCFWENFSTLFELHFPLTKIKNNKNLYPKNDFMTPGLLTSRLTKINLHKLSLTNPTVYLSKYKTYRNVFNATIRASKNYIMKLSSNNMLKILRKHGTFLMSLQTVTKKRLRSQTC